MTKSHGAVAELRCSFCNKSQKEVQKVIAGPTVFICNECVEVCNDILADDSDSHRRPSSSDEYVPDVEPTDLFPFKCPSCGHQWKVARKR